MPSAADDLLAQMAAAYAACSTYRDEGVVTTTFYGPSARIERRPFSTRFLRPNHFMFEFRDRRGEGHWNQYAVWLQDGAVQSWWSIDPDLDQPSTLRLALAGATGVSGGSAHRVPNLLIPDLFDQFAERAEHRAVHLPGSQPHGCLIVECTRRAGRIEQLWIDPATHLLRRVVEPRKPLGPPPPEAIAVLRAMHPDHADRVERLLARDNIEVETVTEYDAAFDTPITRELRFDPPVE